MLEGQQIGPPAMPAVFRILSRFDRQQIEAFVTVAIDLLDVADGDPDVEAEDTAGETVPVIDDPELSPSEEDGDPDLEETDAEDSFDLSSAALRYGSGPGCTISDPGGASFGEDDEDDDPAGQSDEDGINMRFDSTHDGPGCKISDDDFEHDGREPGYELFN